MNLFTYLNTKIRTVYYLDFLALYSTILFGNIMDNKKLRGKRIKK